MAKDVPLHVRFWVYAVQGVLYELTFTALWNCCVSPNARLMGESSIWSMWVYGMGSLLHEVLIYTRLKHHHIVPRIIANLVYTYAWEYANGCVLRLFGACPWDYAERKWNVHGLITFEYIPVWIVGGILHEQLIEFMGSICWCEKGQHVEEKESCHGNHAEGQRVLEETSHGNPVKNKVM